MPSETKSVGISGFRGVSLEGNLIVFQVRFVDGTDGTLKIPSQLGGVFIDRIHHAYLDGDSAPIPELDVARLGITRDSTDHLILKIDTAQAHTIVCKIPPDQLPFLQERLESFDDLAIVKPREPN
jgi:hypothetical protein